MKRLTLEKECTAFMKEFVCYRVKNLILPNIDIMKIKRERKKFFFERQQQLTEMI